METHDGEEHPEPRRLKDEPEFNELRELLKKLPPESVAAVGESLTEYPPALRVFSPDDNQSEEPKEPPGVVEGRNRVVREDSEPAG